MKKFYFALAGFLFSVSCVFSESFDFVNKEINEILYSVSLFKGISIVPDDTVSGKIDFRCVGTNFDDVFDSFLKSGRLYVEKDENRWIVSKIKIAKNDEGLFSLDGCDVSPVQLFEKVAVKTGLCVTYENLPNVKVSLHTGFCDGEEILRRIAGLCPGFEVEKRASGFFHVAKSAKSPEPFAGGKIDISFQQTDGEKIFACNIQNANLSQVCEKLSLLAEKEFCFSLQNDMKISRAYFSGKNFEETLRTICLQGNAEFVFADGIYFILPSKNKNRMNETGKAWRECNLQHLSAPNFLSLAAKRFPEVETIQVNDSGKFIFLCDEKKFPEFLDFVNQSDVKKESRLVQLKYLQTSEFLANLPPFVSKNEITDSGRGDSFYFTGTESDYQYLVNHMEEFDKPVSMVTYDLLIMQYQTTDGKEWNPTFSVDRLKIGDKNAVCATLGSVMDLNLDVVGAFGLNFAMQLQAAITESKARVFADTTLNGVSGSTITFQNTNTYRYRDNNLDPETGKPIYSGVTKEIVSGLKLEVSGVVTGDGMITSKITASVSRQGTDLSAKNGNPPPSSEKVITTEVRAKSGEPVVLSGLIQNEETEAATRTPILSKIPLLGNLFKSKNKSREKTEMVIYLVPSAEIHGQKIDAEDDFATHSRELLEEFVCGNS